MQCSNCQHDNPDQARFCLECGASFAARCPNCQAELPLDAKFCMECGEPQVEGANGSPGIAGRAPERQIAEYTPKHLADKILKSKSVLEGERKQVTVLFADVQGSMELAEQLDPEEWHGILDRFFQILSEGVHRFEGTINQYTGDGIMALFGAPISHEDHAQRACYAALHLRAEIAHYATELKREHGVGFATRMGINSGEVIVGSIGDDLRMDYTAQGHTVGLAQRMETLAEPNSCFLTTATATLVGGYFALEDMGEFQVRGASAPLRVHRLVSIGSSRNHFDIARGRGLSRIVGRASDLRTLEDALGQAAAGNGQVVGVVAEAGTGKTRLCFEFLERCRKQGLHTFEARALAHGQKIPLLPILELFRAYFGIAVQDDDRRAREKIAGRMVLLDQSFAEALPLLFDFLGVQDPLHPTPPLDPASRQRRLMALLRDVIQSANEGQPTITLIEDLHWIDAASEEFLEQMVEAQGGSHRLLLVNFRPEYHAEWMQKSWYRQVPLTPLGLEATAELLTDRLGPDPSIADLAKPIHAHTGGNPFFTEEVVQSLIESHQLEGSQGAYRLVGSADHLAVPPTVQALLAARIDRLLDRDKHVLQVASVIGKNFSEPLLAAVAEVPETELKAALSALRRAEFIHEQALYPVAEYAFKHPLTQEVALGSQLHERLRRTHAAVGRALEGEDPSRLDENAALLAHHYEEAGEALLAAHWYRRAADWVGMKNVVAALGHWLKVWKLAGLVVGTEADALIALSCSQALAQAWRAGTIPASECAVLFEEGCTAAERLEDLASLAMLNGLYGSVRGNIQGRVLDYVHYTTESVRIADRTGDPALRCGTMAYLIFARFWRGRLREVERFADRVTAIAVDDPDLGAHLGGNSPLLSARMMGLRSLGYQRDPATALRELPGQRQLALDRGYPEQAMWAAWMEAELRYALGEEEPGGLVQLSSQLAAPLGVVGEIMMAMLMCSINAAEGAWSAVFDNADSGLSLISEGGTFRLLKGYFLGHRANAELRLGDLAQGRATAQAGIDYLRESKAECYPFGYAELARAQLGSQEPPADIESTLDEYAALLERSGFHLYEGELHELRAQLAERQGRHSERAAALTRAHDCYTRFGMLSQAERIESLSA